MTYRLFIFLLIYPFLNTLQAQLAITEATKILIPYEEKNVIDTREVEEIFMDFHLDNFTHTIKYDDKGRLTEDFYERKEEGAYGIKKHYSYSEKQQIEITLSNKFGTWDTTNIKTQFYQNNQLITQESKTVQRYKIQQNGTEKINEREKYQQRFYDYDDLGNLLSETRVEGTKTDTISGNIYQYNSNKKLITKNSFSRFFGKRYYQNHIFQYNDLGNLTKEIITEDSTQVIYYFENEQKVKVEFLEAEKLEFEVLYNKQGDATSIKSFKDGELENLLKLDYILDEKGNWKEVIATSVLDKEPPIKAFRKIKYRK